MDSQFDAEEALSRYGSVETTVLVWRLGWAGDKYTFETMHQALAFARSEKTKPLKIQLLVHHHGHDIPIEGDDLRALLSRSDGDHTR